MAQNAYVWQGQGHSSRLSIKALEISICNASAIVKHAQEIW